MESGAGGRNEREVRSVEKADGWRGSGSVIGL